MANGFLSLLPFRPRRPLKSEQKPPTRILPAEDILDFQYPPQSSFSRQDESETDNNFISG